MCEQYDAKAEPAVGGSTEPALAEPDASESAAKAEELAWIELVPAAVAVLESQGTIRKVNAAWRELAVINGTGIPDHGVGANYPRVCETSGELQVARALREVTSGTRPRYTLEYTCHTTNGRHWYRMEGVHLPPRGALLFHLEVAAMPGPPEGVAPLVGPRPYNEVIFLIEDDYQLRVLAARTLRQAGYTVLTASSGAEAMALAETELPRVDLVLSDIMLGDTQGIQLARQLRQRKPELRLLFVSGYAPQGVSDELSDLAHHFLEKPFTPSELAGAVRQALDTSPAQDP